MKIIPLALLLIGLIIGCKPGPENNKEPISAVTQQQQDTLHITDSELTAEPFGLGDNPLKTLISIDNAEVDFRIFKNRHVENQTDTLFQINIQSDRFEVHKAATGNWLSEAKIVTGRFPTRHGIKTGMTKAEVKEKLKLDVTGNLPDFVRLQSLEVQQWIGLEFKGNRLESIAFKGYVD